MSEDHDKKRRKLLATGTAALGAAGLAGVSVPFIASWSPSARARALGAPVEVDISEIAMGELKIVEWRRAPVWILHRTPEMLRTLGIVEGGLRDPFSISDQQPEYAKNNLRSIRPEYLIVVGICTHLGCSPRFRPDFPAADVRPNWKGGFFCLCHRSSYDYAGRVFQGVPAPRNLVVPPHRYLADNLVLIGEDET